MVTIMMVVIYMLIQVGSVVANDNNVGNHNDGCGGYMMTRL